MNKAENNAIDSDIEPRVYELGFLLVPSISDEKLTDAVDVLRAVIDTAGGSIIAEGAPALKELAYEMSKVIANKKASYSSAHFGWLKFDASPAVLSDIKLELESNNDLIRFIIVKTVREDTMESLPTKHFAADEAREKGEAKSAAPVESAKTAEKPTEEKKKVNKEELDEEIEKLVIED